MKYCENCKVELERRTAELVACRAELCEIDKAIDDPRIHNTITIAEWCAEVCDKIKHHTAELEAIKEKEKDFRTALILIVHKFLWQGVGDIQNFARAVLAEHGEQVMDKRCGTCEWWRRLSDYDADFLGTSHGYCDNHKFMYLGDRDPKSPPPADSLVYWDYVGYLANLYTGENFGCVHWKPKEEDKT